MAHNRGGDPEPRYPKPLNLDGFKNFEGLSPEPQEEERKQERAARGQQAEGEIRDAGDRYRIALAQHYDIKDPYGSLARAAMGEYGAFVRDREQLRAQIAKEQDPAAREVLELRQEIQANDYMAITSRRIAAQSVTITGRRDNEEALQLRERAADYEAKSAELREQYRNVAGRIVVPDAEQAKGPQQEDDQTRDGQPPPPPRSAATRETKAQAFEQTRGDISEPEAARLAQDAQRRETDPRIVKEETQLAAEQAKQGEADNRRLEKRLEGVPAGKQKQERESAQKAQKDREARQRQTLLMNQRQREARERQREAIARTRAGRGGEGRGGMEL
jgi:hypothetical protein